MIELIILCAVIGLIFGGWAGMKKGVWFAIGLVAVLIVALLIVAGIGSIAIMVSA